MVKKKITHSEAIAMFEEFKDISFRKCEKLIDVKKKDLSLKERIILERNDAAQKLFDFVIDTLTNIEYES